MKITLSIGKIVTIKEPFLKVAVSQNNEAFIANIIEKVESITDLSTIEVLALSLQDAIYIMAVFRAWKWSSVPLYQTNEYEISPMEIIDKSKKARDIDLTEHYVIGGKAFYTSLPLEQCLFAEDEAITKKDFEHFNLMLLSAGCEGGFKEGWKILDKITSNPITKGSYYSLIDGVKRNAFVTLNLDSNPITMLTKKDKNKIIKEFPFRNSRLFDI